MNFIKRFAVLALIASTAVMAQAQLPKAVTYEGDPMHTQCYTLRNGMKVFLSVNHESPRIAAHMLTQ